jgi:hypothetical protein
MGKKRKITIDELAEEIILQQWEFGVSRFHIVHDCQYKKEFYVDDLNIEIEDNLILIYDIEDKLLSSGFEILLKDSIISVYYYRLNGLVSFDIKYKYGHLYINAVND